MATQPGLFDVEERLQRLSDIGDQLEAYAAVVDFEIFRADLEAALGYADGAKGGRRPYDPVLMFKILVIQAQHGLSDDKAEFLINDRLSFMRFLGLGLSDRVPDAKTIWMFRERLTRAGAIDGLFRRFDTAVRAAGYIAMSGQLVTARWWRRPSNATPGTRSRRSRPARALMRSGRISLRRGARRTWTPVGRSRRARSGRTRSARRSWTLRSRPSDTRPTRASIAGIG